MGVTYPDVYAAVGASVTGAYHTGVDITGAAAYAEMGPRARPMPVFLVEDRTDPLSSVPIGRIALDQWLGTDSLALGPSAPQPPIKSADQRLDPDPANGFTHGRTFEAYQLGPVQVQLVTLDDGGHLMVGDGPGVVRQTIDFLLGYQLP
jgi:hypothetical protein